MSNIVEEGLWGFIMGHKLNKQQ